MKWSLSLTLIPLLFMLDELVKKSRKYGSLPAYTEVPSDLASGISFFDRVIVVKSEQSTRMFSAKCTHLGCQINKVNNGNIICPCHGSEFNQEGKVIKGPAAKSLQELEFQINPENGNYSVKLNQ